MSDATAPAGQQHDVELRRQDIANKRLKLENHRLKIENKRAKLAIAFAKYGFAGTLIAAALGRNPISFASVLALASLSSDNWAAMRCWVSSSAGWTASDSD